MDSGSLWQHVVPDSLIPVASRLARGMSQESSRRVSARREEFFQPKDLGWLDLCDIGRVKPEEEMRDERFFPPSSDVRTATSF
ncbi:hypothetical protein CO652_07850 [Rhizobium sp. H4]|nr:hypothetical protein CO652_07850 [Rhizobium sp. H4]